MNGFDKEGVWCSYSKWDLGVDSFEIEMKLIGKGGFIESNENILMRLTDWILEL